MTNLKVAALMAYAHFQTERKRRKLGKAERIVFRNLKVALGRK